MQTVYKYQIEVVDEQEIEMPEDAKLLTAQMQGEMLCVWALVDNQLPTAKRKILVRGTGHDAHGVGTYISTFQMRGGALVFHVFEG